MLLDFALIAFLIFILVKSSDGFVEAVAKLAKYFGVSEFVIGLTVIAIGTSLPELGASVMAAAAGETELAVGNIIGSNMANIGLILGLSSIIVSLKTNRDIFRRDCVLLLAITAIFYTLSLDGSISFYEGMLLFLFTIAYLLHLFNFKPRFKQYLNIKSYLEKNYGFNKIKQPGHTKPKLGNLPEIELSDDFVGKGFDLESYNSIHSRISIFRRDIAFQILRSVFFGILIYLSARYLIPSAVNIAESLGVTENLIGATLIALGTSLPELSVSISAIRKGFGNMLLGNLIGSSIFNISLVGGLSAMLSPMMILPMTIAISIPLALLMSFALLVFVRVSWSLDRLEGAILFGIYLVFMYALLTFIF
jgi:cation:H+ antiporter